MSFVAPLDRGLYLRTVPLFGDLPAKRLALLVAYARDELIPKGTQFQVAGTRIDWIRVIVEGGVTCQPEEGEAFELGADAVLGVFELFIGRAAGALRATTDVVALAIPTFAVLDILDQHFDVVVHIFRGLGRTLIRSLREAPTLAGSGAASTLPPHDEHEELGEVERILALRSTLAFHAASVDGLASLARTTQPKTFARGEVIWMENDPTSWLGVIIHGVVECETSLGGGRFYFSENEANAVGFLDTLADDKRWYDARANTDVTVLSIQKDDLLDTLEDHFDMTLACLGAFSAFSQAILTKVHRAGPEGSDRSRRPSVG